MRNEDFYILVREAPKWVWTVVVGQDGEPAVMKADDIKIFFGLHGSNNVKVLVHSNIQPMNDIPLQRYIDGRFEKWPMKG